MVSSPIGFSRGEEISEKREKARNRGEREEKKTKATKRGMVDRKKENGKQKRCFCCNDFGKLFKLGLGKLSISKEH